MRETAVETPAQSRDRLAREIADRVANGLPLGGALVEAYVLARGLERLLWSVEVDALLAEPDVFDALDGRI